MHQYISPFGLLLSYVFKVSPIRISDCTGYCLAKPNRMVSACFSILSAGEIWKHGLDPWVVLHIVKRGWPTARMRLQASLERR